MISTLAAVGFFALGVAALATFGAFAVLRWGKPAFREIVERTWSPIVAELEERVGMIEAQVMELPTTWEDFASEAKKQHERARWHIRRVKKELEERGLADDQIDALDGSLHPTDGGGGNGSGVHDMPGNLAEDPTLPPQTPIGTALAYKWRFHG